jgi:UPF0176 protein
MNSKLPFMTAAFYKFVDLPDFADRREKLLALCEYHNVKGLIILAKEGINSTIAGSEESVMAILNYLKDHARTRLTCSTRCRGPPSSPSTE